jgi:outer membrane receptor protein involved in Fe transport
VEGPALTFFDAEGNPGLGELEREDRTTRTETDTWGIALQLTQEGKVFGYGNSLTLGLSYDRSRTDFNQQQEAESEIFAQGLSRGTLRTGPFETEVDIATAQENWGFYFTDTFDITEQLALTFSGRYQMTGIAIRDQSGAEDNADLNGEHDFDRFNPAAGITYSYSEALNFFGGYSESFRAPTPAELTCADPDDPCNLPNAFVADPPLDPYIEATHESPETPANVVDPDGVAVEQGDRLPGIPRHNLKFGLDWAVTPYLWLGGNLVYASDQFLCGDDSNTLDTVDDYVVVNLHTRVAVGKHVELWGRVDNVFDTDYETGGVRNFNGFADPIEEQCFLAPGAPRAGWVGVRL